MYLLYIGPGVGLATTIIVAIVLLIVIASLVIVIWRPIKRLGLKIKNIFNGK